MKRFLVVAALLAAMLLVDWLAPVQVSSAATLAGIGFVMLTAYALAEIGVALSLPQVTGYILAGVALGPSVGGVISGELVGDMRMFNTLALGLIATSAGLELDVRQIGRIMKTLILTTAIKVIVGVALVAVALFAAESVLDLLSLQTRGELATLALILGVLSIGTSPSIALAVLSETRAKGRLSDLVLGAAVFKDLVVVVGLAVATAVGRVWLAPGAALDSNVLANVALELGGSMLAGVLVGAVFILYVRFIRAEMLLFVAAMILVVAELCRAFHLELLLVFITSGFIVRNLSRFEHELAAPLRLVALPVFVLFFANAGASVDLTNAYRILPLALIVCAARTGTYVLASHLGGRWAGEPRSIRQHAWLAYLPQAGVTLGLVGLAALQLPELAGPITNTGMAVVALNLLVGPITLRRALGMLGEIPRPGEEGPAREARAGAAPALAGARAEASPHPPPPLPEGLRRLHEELELTIQRIVEQFATRVHPTLPPLPPFGDTIPDLEAFRKAVLVRRQRYRELYTALLEAVAVLPHVVQIERREASRPSTVARLLRGKRVPLRRIARIALGPSLARVAAWQFEQGLHAVARGARVSESAAGVSTSRVHVELQTGFERLAEILRDVGTGRVSARRLRYSDVEPEVRHALYSLSFIQEDELVRLARAAWGTAWLQRSREAVTTTSSAIVQRSLIDPGLATTSQIPHAVQGLALGAGPGGATGVVGARLTEQLALVRTTFNEIAREFRFAATVRATLGELIGSVAAIPDSIDCLVLAEGASLSEGKVQSVPYRAHVDALIRHMMPPIELAARSVATALNQLPRRIEDVLLHAEAHIDKSAGPASVRFDAAPDAPPHLLLNSSLRDAASATVRAVDRAIAALEISLEAVQASFAQELLPGPARAGQREAVLRRWLQEFRRARGRASHWIRNNLATPLAPAPVNAQELREWLQRSVRDDLPGGVARWFAPSPVADDRLFAGHRRLLNDVLDADGSRAELGRASLLITGSAGAGKSSLLNLCELELPYATHLRLHASEFACDVTLFDAMANLLDCSPSEAELMRQLEDRAPAIFVDDLPSWIAACPDRQAELDRLLQLITQTSHRAFWVASIDTTMLQLFGEMATFEEVFTHVLRLPAFSLEELQRLVEARVELLDRKVEFQSGRWPFLFDQLRSTSAKTQFYRQLRRASQGNPGRAVALCREAFASTARSLLLSSDSVASPRQCNYEFTSPQLATLATLHRYGAQSLERLALELAVSTNELRRSVSFLVTAGVVAPVDDGRAVAIEPSAARLVQDTLIRARLAVSG